MPLGHVPVSVGRIGLALLAISACEPSSETLWLFIGAGSAEAISFEPAAAVKSLHASPDGWLAIEREPLALGVSMPGMCPTTIAASERRAALKPWIDLGPDRAPVGFDATVEVDVGPGCPERGRGEIDWRQVEGPALPELVALDQGFRLRVRMPRFEQVHPEATEAGIVPISPRTQGRVVLEARFRAAGAPELRRKLVLVATSRATGLGSVAVSQQLLLAGSGWQVRHAPPRGAATIDVRSVPVRFTPDAPGRWTLEDAQGHVLTLQASWHDKTPLDCGRAECHAAIAQTTAQSPMSGALSAAPAADSCMLDCHVVGERGLHDGGFLDVQRQLGWQEPLTAWRELPPVLRRLGGVRCTSCHGPGAIPEPGSRALALRSDVCATCHDAPPEYGQVSAWRESAMARADALPSTREAPCARCHTTRGFLDHVAQRPPAEHGSAAGIACAACHAPHDAHRAARLLRSPLAGDPALEPRSALCVACHAPGQEDGLPFASSGALWLGEARVPALAGGWELVRGPAPHRDVAAGCIGCHGAGGGPKLDHSFRVAADGCKSCHTAVPADAAVKLEAREESLAQALAVRCADPGHTSADPQACSSQRLTRARYVLRLLRGDRAAAVHNPAFAAILLDDVAKSLAL